MRVKGIQLRSRVISSRVLLCSCLDLSAKLGGHSHGAQVLLGLFSLSLSAVFPQTREAASILWNARVLPTEAPSRYLCVCVRSSRLSGLSPARSPHCIKFCTFIHISRCDFVSLLRAGASPFSVSCTFERGIESVLCMYSLYLSLSLPLLSRAQPLSVRVRNRPVRTTTGAVGTKRVSFPASISSWSETLVVPPFYMHARNYATYLVNPT